MGAGRRSTSCSTGWPSPAATRTVRAPSRSATAAQWPAGPAPVPGAGPPGPRPARQGRGPVRRGRGDWPSEADELSRFLSGRRRGRVRRAAVQHPREQGASTRPGRMVEAVARLGRGTSVAARARVTVRRARTSRGGRRSSPAGPPTALARARDALWWGSLATWPTPPPRRRPRGAAAVYRELGGRPRPGRPGRHSSPPTAPSTATSASSPACSGGDARPRPTSRSALRSTRRPGCRVAGAQPAVLRAAPGRAQARGRDGPQRALLGPAC